MQKLAQRFSIERQLQGTGGFPAFLATDTTTQQRVIIRKLAAGPDLTSVRIRLEHEARLLSHLNSPAVGPPLTLLTDADENYLVSTYIEGISLKTRLQAGPLSLSRALPFFLLLTEALKNTHAIGVLHRSIRPSHILIEKPDFSKIKFVDFGLPSDISLETVGKGDTIRAACYLAPEQAGLIKSGVDERSDLYALGIVFYECLTGRCPFYAKSLSDVLRLQISSTPRSLRQLNFSLPRVLDEIIFRLLQKDPRQRYQTAAALEWDLQKLTTLITQGEKEPSFVIGNRDTRLVLTEPAFVGRKEELKLLQASWQKTARSEGGIVLIEAESGAGKSRLLEEFIQSVSGTTLRIFFGQGIQASVHRPYEMFLSVATQVVSLAKSEPDFARFLRDGLVEYSDSLCLALPSLCDLFDASVKKEIGPEQFGKERTLRALDVWLDTLGSPQKPALLILDDCQWADDLTLVLLRQWAQQSRRSLMIVVSFRSDEVGADSPLRSLQSIEHIQLGNLSGAETHQLIASMAGNLPLVIHPPIFHLSKGNPFMAGAVLRGILESKSLHYVPGEGWQIDPHGLDNISTAHDATAFLTRRFGFLPPFEKRVLSIAAMLGKRFDLDFLSAVLGQQATLSEILSTLEEARRRQLVWEEARGTSYQFVHDKLRENLLLSLEPAHKPFLHQRAAEWLEVHRPDEIFEIAFHFHSANQSDRALPFALRAAKTARAQHSLSVALSQLNLADSVTEQSETSVHLKLEIAQELGEVLMLMGRYKAAQTQFEKALSFVSSSEAKARVLDKMGELYFKQGEIDAAQSCVAQALSLLKGRIPQTHIGFLCSMIPSIFVQLLHTWFPKIFVGTRPADQFSPRTKLVTRLYSHLCYIYWFSRGPMAAMWAHLKEMNLAEKYPPSAELAQAYSEHAPGMTALPNFRRGERYVRRSISIRRALNNVWGQGQSLNFYSILLYANSRFEEALQRAKEAGDLLERMGDQWELNIANWHVAASYYRMGDLKRAEAMLKELYATGERIGDHQITGNCLSLWAMAAEGNIPWDPILTQLAREDGDNQIRVVSLIAQGIRLLLRENNPGEAILVLQKAIQNIRENKLRSEYVFPAYPWLTTALRIQAEHAKTSFTPVRYKRLLNEAWKSSTSALWIARFYQNHLPHVLRERGIIAAAYGKSTQAKKLLEWSLRVAEKQKALREVSLTLTIHRKIGAEFGWKEIELSHLPVPTDSGEGPAQILSLANRFSTILEISKTITGALTREEILVAVEKSALLLLRAEACFIFQSGKKSQEPVLVRSTHKEKQDPKIINAVFERGETISSVYSTEETSNSDRRSVLGVPIKVRGKVAVCFCVVHLSLDSIYDDEEKRLAQFIAALAGVALENAESFSELTRSNEDLERFAYVASHDLKEPLRMVMLYVQLLKKQCHDKLDREALELINFAVEGATRMYDLINGLLAYSRLGSIPYEKTSVALNTVLQEVLRTLSSKVKETEAVITQGDLPVLLLNRMQFFQVFQNLLSNALKFRTRSTPRIHISASLQNQEWLFSVSDNGIGIQAEHHFSIFALFHRLHARHQYPGTGIGLSICKRIIENHGGRIWVKSEVGQGTCFYFTVPQDLGVGS